ncbi:MAG: GNAT family N-acetyltransferase [Clostridia bacterium]|nr:GNAT family N-acetyltransferase [Clostridia bacterium]
MNPIIDISGVTLVTSRLTLRAWRETDLEDFYEYASVEGVGAMAGWAAHTCLEDTKRVLDQFIAQRKVFALEKNDKVIGSLGIETYDELQFPELAELRCRELGFVLSKDYWGQGLMPEAVCAVVEYLFSKIHLDAILCGHFLWNRQSARVQEKCGFHHYAYNRYKTIMGTVEDNEDCILLREEWENARRHQS